MVYFSTVFEVYTATQSHIVHVLVLHARATPARRSVALAAGRGVAAHLERASAPSRPVQTRQVISGPA